MSSAPTRLPPPTISTSQASPHQAPLHADQPATSDAASESRSFAASDLQSHAHTERNPQAIPLATTGQLQLPESFYGGVNVSTPPGGRPPMQPLPPHPRDAELGVMANGLRIINSPSDLAIWDDTNDLLWSTSSGSRTIAGRWAQQIEESLATLSLSEDQRTQLRTSGAVLAYAVGAAAVEEEVSFNEHAADRVVVARGVDGDTRAVVRYMLDKSDPRALHIERLAAAPIAVIGRLTGGNDQTRGGGTACLQHVAQVALSSGRERITVTAIADAVPFYQKMGFGFPSESQQKEWEDSLKPNAERMRNTCLQVKAHDLLQITRSGRS